MSTLTTALLQMNSCGSDQDASRAKGEVFCREAHRLGADLALFPEMWNIGCTPCPPDADGRRAWQSKAVTPDSPFVTHFRELARELQMAVGLTYLEQTGGAPRNVISLIDRNGRIALTYAKVHTCDFAMERALAPGEGFCVCDLDTRHGPVRVGAMICYDREFPESARVLMLQGAEVILTPNACPLDEQRIGQFRARAFENMVGTAMANYAAPDQNGHSVAFDGMAYETDGSPREMRLVDARASEDIYLAEFDRDRLRAYRKRETWGNAFRKPACYGELTAQTVEEPFVRPESRR